MAATNTYITLDLLKPTPTTIDLAGNFNGRVADSQSFLKLWIKSNGLPYDLTGMTVYFAGVDPKGNAKKIYGTANADQLGDDLQTGRITFYFPAGTFQVEGDWDSTSTYFGVSDSNGTVISTVNTSIHVLANKVDMNVNSGPFYTDLEKVLSDAQDQVAAALKIITDPNSAFNVGVTAAQKMIDAINSQIKANDYIDTTTFNSKIATLTTGQSTLTTGQATLTTAQNALKTQLATANTAINAREIKYDSGVIYDGFTLSNGAQWYSDSNDDKGHYRVVGVGGAYLIFMSGTLKSVTKQAVPLVTAPAAIPWPTDTFNNSWIDAATDNKVARWGTYNGASPSFGVTNATITNLDPTNWWPFYFCWFAPADWTPSMASIAK